MQSGFRQYSKRRLAIFRVTGYKLQVSGIPVTSYQLPGNTIQITGFATPSRPVQIYRDLPIANKLISRNILFVIKDPFQV